MNSLLVKGTLLPPKPINSNPQLFASTSCSDNLTAQNHLSHITSHNTKEKTRIPQDTENSINNDNKQYHKRKSIVGTEIGTTPAWTLHPVRGALQRKKMIDKRSNDNFIGSMR
mmetsp:Transcript_57086/g.68262  ORF Transcript_57086/g.68262 Transcript_57086/m.68262 type:complete len:113 (+) Transcript_57086:65-403(+)